MSNANDTAFPVVHSGGGVQYYGLGKRELLAAMAMQGMLANPEGGDRHQDLIADYAVSYADALLAELAKVQS